MNIALVRDAVPGFLNIVVMNLQPVLLQRHQVAAIVVIIDPAAPHLRVALAILAAIFGSVLDERPNGSINQRVIVPESIAEVALQQWPILGVSQSHQESSIAVTNMARFVGLY